MSKLNIKNLIKSFPSMDRPAVNNVNLDIQSGEFTPLAEESETSSEVPTQE